MLAEHRFRAPKASRRSAVLAAIEFTLGFLSAAEVDGEVARTVALAVMEAIGNVIRHSGSPRCHPDFELTVAVRRRCVVVEVIDFGPGFRLTRRLMPSAYAEHGRGIALMQELCDSVSYRREAGGNRLTLRKRLPS